MSEILVVNASPLIALAKVGQVELLEKLARTVVLPEAVVSELIAGPAGDPARRAIESGWGERAPAPRIPIRVAEWSLGSGESEVITIALSRKGATAVLDDARGRACAKTLGLSVIGTVGLVLMSKRLGFVPSASELLFSLRERGFYFDDSLVLAALEAVGESWERRTRTD